MLNDFTTLRVAVLSSRRAPGLDEILRHPSRGKLFEISCVITSDNAFPLGAQIERGGVPVLVHPIRRFYEEKRAPLDDMETRREYDRLTVEVLKQLGVDTVVLLGYTYVVTDVMLNAFPNRIINVHDSDLTLTNSRGCRKYTGLHSTRDAIVAGELETRSTIHIVTAEVDAGPILKVSGAYPVVPFVHDAVYAGATDVVKAYVYAQREWMMRDAWPALVTIANEQIASGVEEGELTQIMAVAR